MVGDRIKKIRIYKNISQSELADRAGINEKYYGRIERNESCPTIAIIEKICSALNMNVIELFLFEEDKMSLFSNLKICNIFSDALKESFSVHINRDILIENCENSIWYNGYIGSLNFDEFEMRIFAEGNIKAKLFKNYELILELNQADISNELIKYVKSDKDLNRIINYSECDKETLKSNGGEGLFIYESNWFSAEIINNKTGEIIESEIIFDTDNVLECFKEKNMFFDYIFEQKDNK